MKRFIDTNIWEDTWFFGLTTSQKMLWMYLFSKCDNAGVIDLNTEMAAVTLHRDISYDIEADLKGLGERVTKLANGKLLVGGFVEFQYGNLNPKSNLHKNVLALIQKHKLDAIAMPSNAVERHLNGLESHSNSDLSHQVKVEVKVKEEVKDADDSIRKHLGHFMDVNNTIGAHNSGRVERDIRLTVERYSDIQITAAIDAVGRDAKSWKLIDYHLAKCDNVDKRVNAEKAMVVAKSDAWKAQQQKQKLAWENEQRAIAEGSK